MQVHSNRDPTKLIPWDIRPTKWGRKTQFACRSKIQFTIGELIANKYSLDTILEDITIPETRLSLDFFLPRRRLAFEIQGEQHFKRNSYFHKTNLDFLKQQERDEQKKYFCDINNITLITFSSIEEAKEYFKIDH